MYSKRILVIASLAVAGLMYSAQITTGGERFDQLKSEEDVIYLLANSSIIFGADPQGKSEEITFAGPVHVPKFPVQTFERRQLDNGKYQIDFELTKSQLIGESYLLGGRITLGEDPNLRSLGTITQREAGRDYPADFIVQRKVLIETPVGILKNEDAVPVRGTIDSIPPVKKSRTYKDINVFRGEELPVQMLDQDGKIGGWFYSKMHLAFAVDPRFIYRANITGEAVFQKGDKQETVTVEGPIEMVHCLDASPQKPTEIVMLALRGQSEFFGGAIMLTESFSDKDYFSSGRLGMEDGSKGPCRSEFALYVSVKSPQGNYLASGSLDMVGETAEVCRAEDVDLGNRKIPVFSLASEKGYSGKKEIPLVTESEAPTDLKLVSLKWKLTQATGRRPCCPPVPTKQ